MNSHHISDPLSNTAKSSLDVSGKFIIPLSYKASLGSNSPLTASL